MVNCNHRRLSWRAVIYCYTYIHTCGRSVSIYSLRVKINSRQTLLVFAACLGIQILLGGYGRDDRNGHVHVC